MNFRNMFLKNRKILVIFIVCFLLMPFLKVEAVSLYLDPQSKSVAPGDVLIVKVKLEVEEDECVNVGNIFIDFSSSDFAFKDFSNGESIFSLWLEKPTKEDAENINKTGELNFVGGIPGGYCGRITGDTGDSNIIGEAIFEVLDIPDEDFKSTYIEISEVSEIFLNDGVGTKIIPTVSGLDIRIDKRLEINSGEWEKRIKEDSLLPEPFIVSISSYNGQNFVAFSTTDKQTGIDHYEVSEIKLSDLLAGTNRSVMHRFFDSIVGRKTNEIVWEKAESPYPLKDQDLESVIRVRAIDKAGNARIVEYENDELKKKRLSPVGSLLSIVVDILIGLLLVVVIILFVFIINNKKNRKIKKRYKK